MRRDGPGLIDRSEMRRLNLKFEGPIKQEKPSKKKKDKDESIWVIREDPLPMAQPSCLQGYRSLKHKWLSQYQQQTGENGTAGLDHTSAFSTLGSASGVVLAIGDDARLSAAIGSVNQTMQKDERTTNDEPAAQANMGAVVPPSSSEDKVKQKASVDSSLVQGPPLLQHKNSQIDAKLGSDAQASPRELGEFAAARPNSPVNKRPSAQLSRTPSKVQTEKGLKHRLSGSPPFLHQPSQKSPVQNPASPKSSPGQAQKPGSRLKTAQTTPLPAKTSKSGGSKQKSGQKLKSAEELKPGAHQSGLMVPKRKFAEVSPTERSIQDRHKQVGASSQSKENNIEEGAKAAVNSQREERSQHFLATQPKAKDSVVKILYVDGHGSEHLGNLDLSQLESFRELSLTINSAYGHKLPTAQYKLVYRDVDKDLMIHKNEPWSYFKANAATLLLMDSLHL